MALSGVAGKVPPQDRRWEEGQAQDKDKGGVLTQEAEREGIPALPQETPAVTRGTALSAEKDETATLMERMLEAQKRAKERKDRFKIVKKTNYGELPMEAYARLARARTQGQAGSAAGYARRQIAYLQAQKRQADSVEGPRIQAAINQLQKAVTRAGRKKRELQKEEFTELRRKRLEAKQERGKALALRRELRRRQKLRMIREHGYIKEAEIDDRYQQEMAATRLEYQTQLQNFAGVSGTPAVTAEVSVPAGGTGPVVTGGELDIQA